MPRRSSHEIKRVRFTSALPVEHNVPRIDEKLKEDIWWNRQDLKRFKGKAKDQVISESTKNESLVDCLRKVYKLAGRVASKVSQEDMLFGVLQSVPIGKNLSEWCSENLLRGLERPIRRSDLSSFVEYQRTLVKWQHSVDAEELQQISLFLTREDRVFARMLGQGDASAADPSQATPKFETTKISLTRSLVAQGGEKLLQRKVMAQQA